MILVYGDIMVDEYWWGDVSRISPEAPVPVVRVERTETRPGAAANVARNCEALGESTVLVGVSTSRKIRVIGKNQQMLRLDFDEVPAESEVDDAFQEYKDSLSGATVVVISDYGKGTLRNVAGIVQLAKAAGKCVLVDPKGHNYAKYRGADLIKPNTEELRAVVGGWEDEEQLVEKVKALGTTILLTRGPEGMTLFNGARHHFPACAKEVYDVSGAGDTAIATLAVGLHRGLSLEEAVPFANKAAGIVVGRFGTAVVTEGEVFS